MLNSVVVQTWANRFLQKFMGVIRRPNSKTAKNNAPCSKNTTGIYESAVSEHALETSQYPIWNEVKFIDRDPHWYTRRVKEAIHIRLNHNNINRECWNFRSMDALDQKTQQQENGETADRWGNSYSQQWNNGRIELHQSQPTFVIEMGASTSLPEEEWKRRNFAICITKGYFVRSWQAIINNYSLKSR